MRRSKALWVILLAGAMGGVLGAEGLLAQGPSETEQTLALAAHPKGMSYRISGPLALAVHTVEPWVREIAVYDEGGRVRYRGPLLPGNRVSLDKGDLLQIFMDCEAGRECETTEMAIVGRASFRPTLERGDIPIHRLGGGLDVRAALARGLAPGPAAPGDPGGLREGVDELVKQIIVSLQQRGKRRLAVVDFTHLDHSSSDLGRYLSERILTLLFASKRFQVIERNQLKKVMAEQRLSLSDLVDPKASTRLGNLLGVEVLATGSIADLGGEVEVNARLIATESGEVFAVATHSFRATSSLRNLMGKRYQSLD